MKPTLKQNLILTKYLMNQLNVEDFEQLRQHIPDRLIQQPDCEQVLDILLNLNPQLEPQLTEAHQKIELYVKKLRSNRSQPDFRLKYFQYLALVLTQLFLDKLKNHRELLVTELNQLIQAHNQASKIKITPFTENQIQKIAYWMATGSGKTLIMHINYWQLLNYDAQWDNILLITPNQMLSSQHFNELQQSGIPAKLYNGNIYDLKTEPNQVLVLDIYKLTEQKQSAQGVSIDISAFDGKNLIFIDEGHKGQQSEEMTWKKLRQKLGQNGFILEYSATFAQVVEKNPLLLDEYAKAILFDYSYKYFYNDGYGKDFYIFNVKPAKPAVKNPNYTDEQLETLLIVGLLTFYQQLLTFYSYPEHAQELNIEKPLWTFVGSRVSGQGLNSDIVRVIQFLQKVTTQPQWLKSQIQQILTGKKLLKDSAGKNLLADKFPLIQNTDPQTLVQDIYKTIFRAPGPLQLFEIKNSPGEIAIKTANAHRYFGLINIGQPSQLKKLLSQLGLNMQNDHLSNSLFDQIDKPNSHLNLLLGSKKFIEGWNSWRVSTMGLINIGKGQGPQIIQLFGRGVRLKGKNFSLRREQNPDLPTKLMQTLFIFGLNADYINIFLQTIAKEGIKPKQLSLPKAKLRKKPKKTPKTQLRAFHLTPDQALLQKLKLDLRPKLVVFHGTKQTAATQPQTKPIQIPEHYLELLDWQEIFFDLVEYKLLRNMTQIILSPESLKQIALSRKYQIFINPTSHLQIINQQLTLKSPQGLQELQNIITTLLKKYLDLTWQALTSA